MTFLEWLVEELDKTSGDIEIVFDEYDSLYDLTPDDK